MELKYLPILMLMPLLFAGIAKMLLHTTITYKEMAIHFALSIIFSVSVFYIAVYSANYDTYYAHGKVTDKIKDRVTCSHTYQTCVGTGNNRVCTTHRRHSFDNEYWIETTIGNLEISPPDSQGLISPGRWLEAEIGEHYVDSFSFQNYLLNSEYSIMNKQNSRLTTATVSRPQIFDYYRMNPVVTTGIAQDTAMINFHLTELLKTRGHKYNINILLVAYESNDYIYAVEKNWKPVLNDIIIVLNVENNQVKWAEALTYASGLGNEQLITDIRHDLPGSKIDNSLIDKIVSISDLKYQAPSEKDFERLKFEMELTGVQWLCIFIFNLIFNIAVSVYMHRNDL